MRMIKEREREIKKSKIGERRKNSDFFKFLVFSSFKEFKKFGTN